MELAQCLAKLSTIFHSPFFELPGAEIQFTMQPHKRDLLIEAYNGTYKDSAVMILIFPDENDEASTLFIKRTQGYGVHSGQIALPGGAFETEDTNLIQTAIRETHEEIGVLVETNNVFGSLTKLKVPVSGFEITPVIAYTDKKVDLKLDAIEVDEVIQIGIDELLNTTAQNGEFDTPYNKISAPYFDIKGNKLWGATAMIIAEFKELF